MTLTQILIVGLALVAILWLIGWPWLDDSEGREPIRSLWDLEE